ncbi:hypothetical protein PPACK8108_LOCUS7820, partial [Phakopsora pachyrhizi]
EHRGKGWENGLVVFVKFGGDCNNCWSFELRESPENAAYDHQLRKHHENVLLVEAACIQGVLNGESKKSFWTQPKIDRALELTDAEIVEEHMDANRNEEGGVLLGFGCNPKERVCHPNISENNKDDKEEEVAEDKHIKSKQHIAKSIVTKMIELRIGQTASCSAKEEGGHDRCLEDEYNGGIGQCNGVLLELSKAINRVVKDLGLPIREMGRRHSSDERWHSQGTGYKDQKDKDRIRILKGLKDKDRIRTIKGLKDKKGKIKK